MKRYLLPILLTIGLVTGPALSQNLTQSLQGSQDPRGPVLMDSNNNVYFPRHVLETGQTPTLSGTNCAGGTISGTDFAGTLTGTSTAYTSCVVTFTQAFAAAPTCLVSWATGPLAAMSWTTTTTALTITQTSTASTTINWLCTGLK